MNAALKRQTPFAKTSLPGNANSSFNVVLSMAAWFLQHGDLSEIVIKLRIALYLSFFFFFLALGI